ncbi:hypothetical protein [Halomonas sp. OfavH-34-E]|uniref:hypothetical protein n=1 Tax=Halomonas sp. OfavH-34-E TaxID=2954491 RepID=UPI002096C829|nr:hypothetical protein [Halomonas sp. OfavH-34-E]MCO7214152.1 hypothetical protein [Halomonas sp. OfavH-34-E]
MSAKTTPREAAKLIAFVFALGVAFQLGVGLTSIATPIVKKIEIHTTHQGAAAAPDRMGF